MLFTIVEELPIEVGIERLFGESGKTVRRIHDTAIPSDQGKDLVTINDPAMDRAYTKISYPCVFSDPKEPP